MSNQDLDELAALDAVGTLDDDLRRDYLARLAGATDAEREAIAAIYDAAAALASAPPTHEPPPALRQRILDRIGGDARVFSIRAGEGDWRAIGIEGLAIKVLSVDPIRESMTLLLRIAPGAAYPAHRHTGAEECYVIAGEVIIEGDRLRAGDFHHAGPGSAHQSLRSETGAEVLLVVETRDYS